MKASLAIAASALLVWAGFHVWPSVAPPPQEVPAAPGPPASPPPTSTDTDAKEVFQRAFWRRPAGDDIILHAERREWSGPDGVDRWQWFIAIKPSAAFKEYLIGQNPFSLVDAREDVDLPSDRIPEWFPKSPQSFRTRQSADGGMLVLIDSSSGILYATGEGRGFAKGTETPQPVSAEPVKRSGRLPDAPPPSR